MPDPGHREDPASAGGVLPRPRGFDHESHDNPAVVVLHSGEHLCTLVNMNGGAFASELRGARTARGMSLQAVAQAAKVSAAYVHKLEAGSVRSPSPRVLLRLAGVLGLKYERLMQGAGYAVSGTAAAGAGRKGANMKKPSSRGFTNEEIVRLLGSVQKSLDELAQHQDELAREVRSLAKARRAPGVPAGGGHRAPG